MLAVETVLLTVSILVLTGCGKTAEKSPRTEVAEAQLAVSQVQAVTDDGETQERETGQAEEEGEQEKEKGVEADIVVHRTKEEWDEIDLKERAELEDKVKAAGGISEEKAVEIARKAMETDLGEKAGELELCVDATFGWNSDLCVADWSEIKEKDRGALAYTVGFNNAKTVTEMEDLCNYNCTVNAVDGSILEAYTIEGWDHTVYYEH